MLEILQVINLNAGPIPEELCLKGAFVMRTCQRSLIVTTNEQNLNLKDSKQFKGVEAYIYLLEIICGLQSKLLGENEITRQFREAYNEFIQMPQRNTSIQRIMEKLFQDSKSIRSQYLSGIGQKTYAAIARKHLVQRKKASHVLILGSGQLAEDLINQLKKKTKVYICARNQDRVNELVKIHGIETYDWHDRHDLKAFPFVANTIGCSRPIWEHETIGQWHSGHSDKLFVDLASPSPVVSDLTLDDGMVRLQDIFDEGALKEDSQKQQIKNAQDALYNFALNRKEHFKERAQIDKGNLKQTYVATF